jgi:aspartyl aminopeptidase
LEGGKGYYFTRNNSTLVAFTIGKNATQNGASLYKIIGCHTDSPVLKLAPVTKIDNKGGYQ